MYDVMSRDHLVTPRTRHMTSITRQRESITNATALVCARPFVTGIPIRRWRARRSMERARPVSSSAIYRTTITLETPPAPLDRAGQRRSRAGI